MSAAFEDIRVDRVKAALTDPAAVAAFESLMEQLDGAMEVAVGAERAAFLMRGEVAAAERERARADRAEAALAALLEWAEKDKGGYVFSDPSEEWFAIRDYARHALSAGSGGREPT